MLTLKAQKSSSWLCGKEIRPPSQTENVFHELAGWLLHLSHAAETEEQYHVDVSARRVHKVGFRFEFIEDGLLGVGSFGRVILARDDQTKEYVAVKVLEADKLRFDRGLQKGLEREVVLLNRLQHPNIVDFIGLFVMKGYICMAMEYLPGGDLFQALQDLSGNQVREAVARDVIGQLLSAILHMHASGIVHRDLKLENILLDWSDGDQIKAKVADFGLSRPLQEGQMMLTQCGSHDYAPPEIHLGVPYEGRLVDAWSFGVIMYALLCGDLPFPDDQTMTRCIVQGKFKVANDRISPEAKGIIEGLLRPDPNERLSLQELAKNPFFY
jgi:5'-AMP-activated protein kinase catalytic alpha subunit